MSNAIVKAIAKAARAQLKAAEAPKELSPKEKALNEFFSKNSFDCNQDKVIKLVEVITGVKVDQRSQIPMFGCFYLKNYPDHHYLAVVDTGGRRYGWHNHITDGCYWDATSVVSSPTDAEALIARLEATTDQEFMHWAITKFGYPIAELFKVLEL